MAKAELGDKQICPSCGAKFYDLRRRPATCPKCSTSFDPSDEGMKVKRGRARVAAYSDDEEEEEEVEAKAKVVTGDDDEDEVEETPEIDPEAADAPVALEDDAEPVGDELPPGFSEDEGDLEDDAAEDDDSVPLLEDEEEFPEDEIGDLPADDDEGEGR